MRILRVVRRDDPDLAGLTVAQLDALYRLAETRLAEKDGPKFSKPCRESRTLSALADRKLVELMLSGPPWYEERGRISDYGLEKFEVVEL